MVSKQTVRRRFPWLAIKVGLIAALAALPGANIVMLSWQRIPEAFLLGLAVTVGLSALAAALAMHMLVTWPLRVIVRDIHRIDDGDFAWRSGATSKDEMGMVMRALDLLAGRLDSRVGGVRATERRYRQLYEHSPAGLFRTRIDGRVVDCNMAAVRMLGYDSIVDAKTRNATTYYAEPQDRELVLQHIARDGFLGNLPVSFRRKDGHVIPVLLTIVRTQEGGETYLEGMIVEMKDGHGRPGLPATATALADNAPLELGDVRFDQAPAAEPQVDMVTSGT
jgi:PAS domain S-box-containing protein